MISGFTVMIAMAGMYLAGAPDLHLVRHRDDHRGRRRGRRLADGAARDSRVAGRPGREGRGADHQGPALERRRRAGSGRASSTAVLRHPVVAVAAAGGLLVFLAIPAFSLHTANPARVAAQDLAAIKTYNKIQDGLPRRADTGRGGGRAGRRDAPAGAAGDRRLRARAAASANFQPPVTIEINTGAHGRADRHPDRRRRERLALERGAGRAARRRSSRRRSARCRTRPPT